MLLSDVLEFPVFKNATLITPSDMNIDNRVESVMVLEGTDIDYWGRENELLLTSYFALIDLEDSEVESFFSQLASISIAGLVIKVNRLVNEVPEIIVRLCKKHNIPLIQIPENIRYKDIMLAINEPLLEKQNHVLKAYYDASRIYNDLPLADTTFEDIIKNLSQLVKKPVSFSLPGKNINISTDDSNTLDNFIKVNEDTLDTQFTQNAYTITTLLNESNNQYMYSINSTVYNKVISNFSIKLYYNSTDEFDYEADLMVVENIVHLIRQKLQLSHLLKQEKFMLKNNLSSTILQSTTRPSYEYQILLDEANISDHSHYKLIGFQNDKGDTKTYTNQKLNYLRSLGISNIYYEHSEHFIIIFNIKPQEEILTKEFLEINLSKNIDSNMVITSEGTKENINELFIECLDLLNYKRKFKIPDIISLDDLGVFKYLTDIDINKMEKMIPTKLREIQKNDQELYETLVELLNHNMNYTDTADALYVHPKTVRYRIDKLESLLKVDLKDSRQFTNYFIYVSLINLFER